MAALRAARLLVAWHSFATVVVCGSAPVAEDFDEALRSADSAVDRLFGPDAPRAKAPTARKRLSAAAVGTAVSIEATVDAALQRQSATVGSTSGSGAAESSASESLESSESSVVEDAVLRQEKATLQQQVRQLEARIKAEQRVDAKMSQALRSHDGLLRKSQVLMRKHLDVIGHLAHGKASAEAEAKGLRAEIAVLKAHLHNDAAMQAKAVAAEATKGHVAEEEVVDVQAKLRASQAAVAELRSELQLLQAHSVADRQGFEADKVQGKADLVAARAKISHLEQALGAMQAQMAGEFVQQVRSQTNVVAQPQDKQLLRYDLARVPMPSTVVAPKAS